MQSLVSDDFCYYPQIFTLNLNFTSFICFPVKRVNQDQGATKALDQCGIHILQRMCLSRQNEAAFWTPKDRLGLSPLDSEVSGCTWGWRQQGQVCEPVRCFLCEVQMSRKPNQLTASCCTQLFHWFYEIDHMVVLWLPSFDHVAVLDSVIS